LDHKSILTDLGRSLLAFSTAGMSTDIISLLSKVNSSQRDLDQQVADAMTALTTSSQLISNLESSLELRAEKLGKLQEEYKRVSKLAEITKEQGDAVAKTLEVALGKNRKRERLIAFLISLVAGLIIFILGAFLSEWVLKIPELIGIKPS
jgi:hypothetical protein